ncbi:hypothetical protein J6590_010859 [Homalodisca vitripennis]|nr:hypothetical protein J6590_010859 [Homalodisca vitripennis]
MRSEWPSRLTLAQSDLVPGIASAPVGLHTDNYCLSLSRSLLLACQIIHKTYKLFQIPELTSFHVSTYDIFSEFEREYNRTTGHNHLLTKVSITQGKTRQRQSKSRRLGAKYLCTLTFIGNGHVLYFYTYPTALYFFTQGCIPI